MMGITNHQKTASEKQIAYDNELDKRILGKEFGAKIKALAADIHTFIDGDYASEITELLDDAAYLCLHQGDEDILGRDADQTVYRDKTAAKVGAEIDGFIKDMFFTSTSTR
jgi:hypothetical protein